jgi:GDSL-like Lipase/Acylhydrolase family
MTESHNNSPARSSDPETATLPRRDYYLLPLISLATILLIFGVAEFLTRVIWAEQKTASCTIIDPIAGDHFKPNCTARTKNAEGPWTTYQYNECGYRSATSCGPKPPGTIRIAILGSSVSQGLNVPYEQTYFARIATELSRSCNRPVDVQNLGVPGSSPIYAYRRVREALALKPDVVLYLLAPFDLEQRIDPKELAARNDPAHNDPARTGLQAKRAVQLTLSPMKRLEGTLVESRTVLVAQHFLFQNRDTFLRMYMLYGDKADFLRQPFTPAWQQRFQDLDLIIGDMADRLHAAGVPLVVIPAPSRAEAALLSSPQLPPNVDPSAFGHQIEMIASKHGAVYVDLMAAFRDIPNSESLFYVVDGHATTDGQKVIAQIISRKLLDGSVPAFVHCTLQQNVARER